ncbi:hypothetical protein AgCh_005140 [Apium graveolens]
MDESKDIMKGWLGPGMMITVDLTSGQVPPSSTASLANIFQLATLFLISKPERAPESSMSMSTDHFSIGVESIMSQVKIPS